MSGKIDYNELDKAVLQASKPKTAKTSKVGSQVFVAQKKAYPPRTRYMDFIARPRKKAATQSTEPKTIPVSTASTPAAQTPRRVARFAPASAGMPNYRVASSHVATKPHSIPTKPAIKPAPTTAVKPVASTRPVVAVKPLARTSNQTPTTKVPAQPVERPAITRAAAKPAPKTVISKEEKVQAKNTAAAAEAAVKTIEKKPSSPNANNYSIGVKSPFIRTDAVVEKRPLGNASEYVSDDKVEKSSHVSDKIAPKVTKSKKTKVVGKRQAESKSWIWPLIILLIIAAGGGLGYLAFRVLENAF